jgi:glycosyltransferase involved in cell wall biosynthesis
MARRNFLARQNCLVMAAPSSNEGFCLPVVEALLSGAQVVCSNIPVLREVGSDACTYFHPGADFVQNFRLRLSVASKLRSGTHLWTILLSQTILRENCMRFIGSRSL